MKLTKSQRAEIRGLKKLNATELVQLLTEVGIRAHIGMSRLDLATALVTGRLDNEGNPFDKERYVIESFLEKNWDRIKSQLDVKCHGNCHQHSDMQVLACWLNSQRVLERGE